MLFLLDALLCTQLFWQQITRYLSHSWLNLATNTFMWCNSYCIQISDYIGEDIRLKLLKFLYVWNLKFCNDFILEIGPWKVKENFYFLFILFSKFLFWIKLAECSGVTCDTTTTAVKVAAKVKTEWNAI